MELNQETDAEAIWQDTLDLLADEDLSDAVLAMLNSCVPTKVEEGVLFLQTNLRIVTKKVGAVQATVEKCLSAAAFEPMHISLEFVSSKAQASTPVSTMSRDEVDRWSRDTGAATAAAPTGWEPPRRMVEDTWDERAVTERREASLRHRTAKNPLVEDISDETSKLTFERFVQGEENNMAYQAAIQVANGKNSTYNPLFIYGKSGLGKTHLLRAIQNYIAKNDPTRLCVYRDASSFISDYTDAMRHSERSAASALRQNYADIDVLIIDDIQKLAGKAGTVSFFFDVFNALITSGKQIVLAADRSPSQLGMGKDGFDERVVSRLGQGFTVAIHVPNYELKLNLIHAFCNRLREDAIKEGVPSLSGTIPEEIEKHMAERSGTNIRLISGFCQSCLFKATDKEKKGSTIQSDDVDAIAKDYWPNNRKNVSIEDVQRAVENYYDIDHTMLVGNRRNKEVMEPRHVAIWLCRELCDRTLEDIGKHFGGRTHATIIHSVNEVEASKREDKAFYDRVMQIRENITGED